MRILKRREHNNLNYCIDFNQILLNDNGDYIYWVVHQG